MADLVDRWWRPGKCDDEAGVANRATDIFPAIGNLHRSKGRTYRLIKVNLRQGNLTMSEDERNFIERAASITGNLYGEPMSPERIAENFALYGLKKRVAALERFDAELGGDIDSSPHSLRKRVQLVDLRRRMGGLHEALRNAKR
ncbi:hypothetical protein ACQ86E_04195 [Bradyrhizobium betae]|uniref:hypothetical protein n=1 Tax=Bradyrhizobium betae TaxID=244734 RepID=UPI003D6704F6